MKTLFVLALVILSKPAFALELNCTSKIGNLTIAAAEDSINVGNYIGQLSRETKDPDCVYRENHFACYEDGGQIMVNIPLNLMSGKNKSGTVYVQTDTGDNADSRNLALLGDSYFCVTAAQ